MQTIKDLFASKKWLVSILAAVVAFVGSQFPEHADTVNKGWMSLLAFVGAQGLADFSKNKPTV